MAPLKSAVALACLHIVVGVVKLVLLAAIIISLPFFWGRPKLPSVPE